MRLGRALLTLLLVPVAILVADAGAAVEPRAPKIVGFASAQLGVVEWAVALFAEAGLPLPELDVVHHATTEPCRGRQGMHHVESNGSVIDICTDEAGPTLEFLLVHELAHAWERRHVTEGERAQFLTFRGLTTWQGGEAEHWGSYGAEQAAEIVVWALMDRPIWPVRITYENCQELAAGYTMLTARPPLHGYTDYCDDPAYQVRPK